jgi:hypothetical protein
LNSWFERRLIGGGKIFLLEILVIDRRSVSKAQKNAAAWGGGGRGSKQNGKKTKKRRLGR